MGCSHGGPYCRRIGRLAISFLILVISTSSHSRLSEGRRRAHTADNSETPDEEKATLRAQIGSRPPRCDGRCASCRHCEAIQVPTSPQTRSGDRNSTSGISVIAHTSGDGGSNYKPVSWKCKCGNLVFNP